MYIIPLVGYLSSTTYHHFELVLESTISNIP
jgi:hypothetical protein